MWYTTELGQRTSMDEKRCMFVVCFSVLAERLVTYLAASLRYYNFGQATTCDLNITVVQSPHKLFFNIILSIFYEQFNAWEVNAQTARFIKP